MPIFATSQEWLHQSQLLLEARPATTRVTTRYSIRKAEQKPHKDGETLPDAKPPRARLVLKTYDDVSGACLKYRTSKAAEVSRLIQMLGSLGRKQAALPPRDDGLLEPAGGAVPTPIESEATTGAAARSQQPPAQQQGGGAKGKKKKGKR
ncbi:uncharacterized protein PpBr36_05997 [Pyricularia pennisetigena]|uniref:uncharacterized protein n=1 Tax=Pyricularia pennisetigena TaxID=1578925 RepID=UPI00114E1C79|nr:uncharacterized protein PpBr36_05997 [Pyricularia pennisetigena]TLS23409.1 hypothetical protein PpBr36_05997 [Pyricularia pennisetigena]